MNMLKLSAIALLFVVSLTLKSQTFDDFKKQVNSDYSDFKQKTIQSFNEHIEKVDKEFADYLVSNFGEQTLKQFQNKNNFPKPEVAPVHDEHEQLNTEIIEAVEADNQLDNNELILPIIKKTEMVDFATRDFNIDFFGSEIKIVCDENILAKSRNAISPETIAEYWTELSTTNYNHLINQFSTISQNLNLNDWAYYLLINSFVKQVYPDEKDMQSLLSWYLLSRSGYKTRVAFDENQTYLLLSSVYPLAANFVRFDNINYYLMNGSVEQLQTYEKDMPEADMIMDFSISKPLNLSENKVTKKYLFRFHEKNHELELSYNQNLIDFYKTIPLSDIRLYFNSLPGTDTKYSLAQAFKPLIVGKSETEAANMLLSFVQQGFDYKTDQDAYGAEKYMFADELLSYPYADCEDRSVLFAYLAKSLLNTDVVGVEFPGHMATAIHFDENPPGDYLIFNQKNYVIADPTFIGAPIGMLMPGVNKSEAEIVEIKTTGINQRKAVKIWQIVRECGGFRSDVLQDVVFAPSGNAYVCGYFVKEAKFGNDKLVSEFEGRDMFIAKFDKEMNPVWAKKAIGPGNDMAYSLALDTKGILYVYGSIEQSLDFEGTTIDASLSPDVFVARYGPNGDIRWVSKAGIDKIDHSENFMFSAKFNPNGEKIAARLYNETVDFDYYGLNLDGNGNAVITGSFYATTGLSTVDFKNYNSENDIPKVLNDTNNYLRNKLQYEQTIAGLFSALKLIRFNSFELKGNTIQKTIETYNKPFVESAEEFYNDMGKMSFAINNSGIILIRTKDKQDVDFSFIRIKDNARIKIVSYENGTSKVDILSGIELTDGSETTHFDMNSIALSKDKGDLLLDYDDDHTKIKLNLRTDILQLK